MTATSSVHALRIERHDFHRLIAEHPVVRLDILTALTQRIRREALGLVD